jgi:hypothetical protein
MRLSSFQLVPFFAGLSLGCQPEIGDPCDLPSDCTQNNEARICDTTLHRNGYCTVFNCEPGGCPEEAVCVSYQGTLSSVDGCRSVQGGQRLERTWCLKSCSANSDCRTSEGFRCVVVDGTSDWSASVVDRGATSTKVCAIPYDGQSIPEEREANVCTGESEGELPKPLSTTDSGAGGTGGMPADASTDALQPSSDALAPRDASHPDTSADAPVDGAPPSDDASTVP